MAHVVETEVGTFSALSLKRDDSSYLASVNVPTYKLEAKDSWVNSLENHQQNVPPRPQGLEGALGGHGPGFVLDHVWTQDTCQRMIETLESIGFGSYNVGKNHHGALQLLVSPNLAQATAAALCRHVDMQQLEERRYEMERYAQDCCCNEDEKYDETEQPEEEVRLVPAGLNRRWRVYKYSPGGEERFMPHIDSGFPPSGLSEDGQHLVWNSCSKNATENDCSIVSRLTVLLYLNEDFVGGSTRFYQPASWPGVDIENLEMIASIRPKTGSCLVFPQGVYEKGTDYAKQHWPYHEGSPVRTGSPKYVIRTDILFEEQRFVLPVNDPLSQYDHLVRQVFLPQPPVLDRNFLSQTECLYNPHMGAENLGPLLYSFLRFTKKRRVVEIGAGYTTLWILQALKDNDDEMERIRDLNNDEKCRLLDWPWTAPPLDRYDAEDASLLTIDDCEHKKETATGARAVSKGLGLEGYMRFMKADAFKLALAKDSVDVMWCDFGVGNRMKDFVSSIWPSLRNGGFLLCHSTLTNQRTRDWLEAARSHQGEDMTGFPTDEYVEVSLLEPHKHYQNSVSVFQKRKEYEEPVYSEFA